MRTVMYSRIGLIFHGSTILSYRHQSAQLLRTCVNFQGFQRKLEISQYKPHLHLQPLYLSSRRGTKTLAEKVVENSGPLEPYLKLMRLHKPIGCWLLFWPFGWSIALTAVPGSLPDIYDLFMFCSMAFIMRGAGCTINDMWDKNIDTKVARTKDRPLARNDITQFDALVFLGVQLGIGCLILLQYNFYTVMLSAASVGLVLVYPLTKKFLPWPQLFLGLCMNYGCLLGGPAVNGFSDWSLCLPLYVGGICWTVIYDTIYAYQDVLDDKKLGLKSTAISFGTEPRLWLSSFGIVMISSFALCGILNQQTWPFYLSLASISTHLANQIYTINVNDAGDCGKKFVSNQNVGLILFLGIIVGNLLKDSESADQSSSSRNNINLVGNPPLVPPGLNDSIFKSSMIQPK